MKPEPQSKTQEKMLRWLQSGPVETNRGRSSALLALARRGLALYIGRDTNSYATTSAGQQWVREHPEVRE